MRDATVAFGALASLAALTFALSFVDLRGAELPVALGIAAIKASVVGWVFMHLREQRFGNFLALATALTLLATLLALVLGDVLDR